MLKQFVAGVGMILAASAGAPALALDQSQPSRGVSPQDQVQARYNISMMEGVLERAVEHGADMLRRQVQRVMPDMLLLSGGAEARGFRLDGYGVFFDVEVPVMRRSMAWTFKTMVEEDNMAAAAALRQIKAAVDRMAPDSRERGDLLQAIKRLELQVAPAQIASPVAASGRGGVTALDAPVAPSEPARPPQPPQPVDPAFIEDPNASYEREVIAALIDAMLDHSGPINIGADEWLTVAARDNEHRDRLVPGEPYDLLTIILRVKGSELAAFRAGRLNREEARKRVEIREF